jgi:tetraacyldisaccharide 4'-kinase
VLAPLERVTAWLTARRVARPGWVAPVPVICCGNVTAGGAGKTTLALDLGAHWRGRGRAVHFLTRGYGGNSKGVTRVGAGATAAQVGDEALLLSALAPTWVSSDRGLAARAAIAAGANLLIMDDGLQNPSLQKTMSVLTIDGRTGFGNGHLLPAGPLREPIAAAAARCAYAVLIGPDTHGVAAALPQTLPLLRARLVPGPGALALAGVRVLAFAGIASPAKFFATLVEAGADPVRCVSFPDHHPYRLAELHTLLRDAECASLQPVTTAKDAVRLPADLRGHVHIADVSLEWDSPCDMQALLDWPLLA